MTLHMFSDESKARGDITGAVVVPAGTVARVRATCREWAMPGSRRFHAQKESTARRRLALASLVSAAGTVQVVIVESDRGQHDLSARGAHVLALADWAGEAGVSRWVIERDESVLGADRQLLSAARVADAAGSFEYVHLPAAQDPVLWAADLVAWSWARGGEFRAAIDLLLPAPIRV